MSTHHYRIALAVIAALAGVAHADSGNITIKGDLRVGFEHLNQQADFDTNPNSAAATAASQNRIDGRGNIYFSGAEDLGNGNSAIFQIGSRFSTDGSGVDEFGVARDGTFGNRNTWVGLKGGWGTLRLGKGEDNFGDGKYDKLTVWGDTPIIGMHAKRHGDSNMVRYDLPAFGSFTSSLQYKAGENKTSTTKADDAYVARGDYAGDGWDAGAAYEGGRNKGFKFDNYLLAGSVTFAGVQAGLEYSHNKNKDKGSVGKTTGLYVNYTIDKLTLAGQYYRQKVEGGSAGDKFDVLGAVKHAGVSDQITVGANATDKAKTWALGASYALSKRTKLYGEYWHAKIDSRSEKDTVFALGVKHSF